MSTTKYLWAPSPGQMNAGQMNNVVTASHQVDPAIAANLDGTAFMGAWGTWPGVNPIEIRSMDGSGAPITSETGFYANSIDASIAPLQNGGFILACTNYAVDPKGDIRLATIDAQGVAKTFLPVDTTANADREADVALLSDGGFVVTWTRDFGAGDNDIVGQVFNADGSLRGGHFTGNSSNALSTTHSSVAGLAGGGFVTVWQQSQVGSNDTAAVFMRYDAFGNALGNSVVFDNLGSTNKDIQVAGLPDGGFVVAYQDSGWGNGSDITARVFNADGTTRTSFLHVNDPANNGTTAGDQYLPSLTVMSNGGFAVGWRDDSAREYVQAYDANGNPLGTNVSVETNVNEAEIAGLHGGGLAMVANSLTTDGSGSSIRYSTYDLGRLITGDDTSEMIKGVNDGLRQTIYGKGGDDTIVGGKGDDTIDGGAGTDTVTFAGPRSAYQITHLANGVQVTGPDGVDVLTNVEFMAFSDKIVSNVTPHWMATSDIGAHPAGWQPAATGDFNHDGASDLLWFNPATGHAEQWMMANGQWAGSVDIGSHPAGYAPMASGDFNADGTSDVLWYNPANGNVDLWKISNGQWAGSVDLGSHPLGWQPAGSGDFNADGTSDVLWFNPTNGDAEVWKIANGQWAGSVDLGTHPAGYTPVATGDFNGDGTGDVLWFNPATHDVDLWTISDGHWAGSVDVGAHPDGYAPVGAGDFNQDGTSDIVWFNAATGGTELWLMADGHWSASIDLGTHPAGWSPAGIGDFDHNGTADIMWQQAGTNHIEAWLLGNS